MMDYSFDDGENDIPTTTPVAAANALQAEDLKKRGVDEALSVAETCCKHYYETLQKKPHLLGQLYLEKSVLIWDGNPICTREGIQDFFEKLQPLTFFLTSMDCQAMSKAAVGDQKVFLIKVGGMRRISGAGTGTTKPFDQLITIVEDQNKWKIASDVLRTQLT